jgi:putative ABC transport system permease protein
VKALDLIRFAWAALAGHRLRSGLSLAGVAIGVASVIVLTSLAEGARLYVTGQFTALGSNLVIVVPGKVETSGAPPLFGGAANPLTLDDADALRRQVTIAADVAPMTLGTATVRFGDRSRQTIVAGTTADFLRVRQIHIRAGRYLPAAWERPEQVCVLGSKIADELFGGRNPLGEPVRIGDARFRVIGIMEPRGVSIGQNLDDVVHIPVASGLKLFNQSSLFRILIGVRRNADIPAARQAVLSVLSSRHDGVEDVTVLTQDAVLSAFSRILNILTAALAGIAAVSLAVAGLGIMNVMLVSVSERVREIGLLKALGATRAQILLAFLVEASMLAMAGGILGLLCGAGAARALRFAYPAFPAQPPGWAIALALALSAIVGLSFGALPARRAASLDPVAALAGR